MASAIICDRYDPLEATRPKYKKKRVRISQSHLAPEFRRDESDSSAGRLRVKVRGQRSRSNNGGCECAETHGERVRIFHVRSSVKVKVAT